MIGLLVGGTTEASTNVIVDLELGDFLARGGYSITTAKRRVGNRPNPTGQPMRFTLPKLLLAVALAGLACAGMVHRTDFWAAGIFTLTLALFVAIGLRAFGLRQRAQASAIAFAAVGILYLMFVMCAREIGQGLLITNYPLALAARAMQVETVSPPVYSPPTGKLSTGVSPNRIQPDDSLGTIIFQANETDATASLGHFFLIGHCAWAWLLATITAAIAGYMHSKGETSTITIPT
jgi:hypothetical protein